MRDRRVEATLNNIDGGGGGSDASNGSGDAGAGNGSGRTDGSSGNAGGVRIGRVRSPPPPQPAAEN